MRTELDIQTLQRAKANAVAFWHTNQSQEFWEAVIDDCDEEIIAISRQEAPQPMYGKARLGVMAVIAIVLLSILFCSVGCKATAGLGRDITWMGEAGEEMLSYESRKK